MDNGYLCHLIFTLSKFTIKNFLFFEMVSPNIFPFFFDIINSCDGRARIVSTVR